ncbi:MAG TPA: acyl-CoA thioesterase [Patescibacteria group bacterium]|nr:acyl-CoA thioesterase [Gammaproteobacteria bacterium]HWA51510.1 acyl-CoA thioesterase [Patescibacteria group bacterium]
MNSKAFSYPIIIKESNLDTFGHVNNAAYLTLFEDARWDLITQNGYGLNKIKETGLGPVVLEMKLRFVKEIRLREAIVIETQMLSYEQKIGRLMQTMLRAGEVCCSAEMLIGLFDLEQRKLVLPTDEWLKAIGL